MTQYTPNYNLDLYEGTDKPDLTDQYDNAMGKVDQALKTSAGNVAELANKVGTLNESLSTANTLIGEINAELTALGVTDAEAAAALLDTINANAAGVAKIPELETVQGQHTREISDAMGDISKIEADYIEGTFANGSNYNSAPPFNYCDILYRENQNKSAFKLWGVVAYNNTSGQPFTLVKTEIPGKPGRYGVRIGLTLSDLFKKRIFSYSGLYQLYTPNVESSMVIGPANFETDENGNVYVFADTSSNYVVPAKKTIRVIFWQTMYSAAIRSVDAPADVNA